MKSMKLNRHQILPAFFSAAMIILGTLWTGCAQPKGNFSNAAYEKSVERTANEDFNRQMIAQ
jgi:hypothetical protein